MDRHHHSHHSSDEYEFPPPGRPHAPPHYGVNDPPPPQVFHTSHSGPSPDFYNAPPQPAFPGYAPPPPTFPGYAPPPPNPNHRPGFPPSVDHRPHEPQFPSSPAHRPHEPQFPPSAAGHRPHEPQFPPSAAGHRPHEPQFPPSADHRPQYPAAVDHHQSPHKEAEWAKKPSVRMYSKAERDYSLTIRNGKVILARSNPADPLQHWVKDEKFSIRVKDEEGFPSFALVNKSTGQALKHAVGATQPVQLIPYNPDILDESILWTESKDLGDGYRTIRMVNNIRLNVDAFNGDKQHGGVHDGTTVVLWEWKKGDNQRWKIVPHCKSLLPIRVTQLIPLIIDKIKCKLTFFSGTKICVGSKHII